MKKYLLLAFIFGTGLLQAQTILMNEKVDSVYHKSKFGVNSKHFLHSYVALGFIFDDNSKAITKFGGSNSLALGLRYKYRITNHLATGAEIEYRYSTFSFPPKEPILKDKYHFHDYKYAWYFRVNLGMRGNIMGKFIDIGLYGSSLFVSNHYVKTDGEFNNFQQLSYYESNLNYIKHFNYGFLLRFGINQFVIFSEYRYSNLIKENDQNQFELLPKWTLGIQISFHR